MARDPPRRGEQRLPTHGGFLKPNHNKNRGGGGGAFRKNGDKPRERKGKRRRLQEAGEPLGEREQEKGRFKVTNKVQALGKGKPVVRKVGVGGGVLVVGLFCWFWWWGLWVGGWGGLGNLAPHGIDRATRPFGELKRTSVQRGGWFAGLVFLFGGGVMVLKKIPHACNTRTMPH